MKIVVTADLHYDIARSVGPTKQLAEQICALQADALIIVGDTCGRDSRILGRCLRLFDGFCGTKLLVAGNHELWTDHGDSLARYERELPAVARRCGFEVLDQGPAILDGVAIVGNMGWYDYSFRSPDLPIPMRFYQAKVAPGAAALLPEYRHLLNGCKDIPPEALAITTRWMDGRFVKLPFDDAEFARRLADTLAGHLEQASRRADHVVVAIHHLPFERLVPRTGRPSWDFANAYMGSGLFGQVIAACPKVRHVVCGHSHRAGGFEQDGLRCTNIGSTYVRKRFEILEL